MYYGKFFRIIPYHINYFTRKNILNGLSFFPIFLLKFLFIDYELSFKLMKILYYITFF